jgi:hypothetical protein
MAAAASSSLKLELGLEDSLYEESVCLRLRCACDQRSRKDLDLKARPYSSSTSSGLCCRGGPGHAGEMVDDDVVPSIMASAAMHSRIYSGNEAK